MSAYSLSLNDTLFEQVKPHFQGDGAMKLWLEKQLEKIMIDYAQQFDFPQEADNQSEIVYQQIKALETDPQGLFKLGGILKPSSLSPNELLDDYISDKYGV